VSPARVAAARALVALERGRTTLGTQIDRESQRLALRRDRALLLEIVAGTLRWRNAIDWVLSAASTRPLAELSPVVRASLRLGAYQLRHLRRVPDRAAVHEAVETARTLGEARAAGYVNAVLRSILRKPPALPPRPEDPADRAAALTYLSVTLSHPAWLVGRWLERHGLDAAERWCRYNNEPPEVTIRPRYPDPDGTLLDRLRAAGLDARPASFVRDAVRLAPGALGEIPPALVPALQVQDEGAQIVAHVVAPAPGDRVLDLCAAPGGKSLVLADALGGAGQLVAADLRPRRVALLARTLRHARVPASVVALDAARPLPFGAVFDRVLLDAPCSGLGTIRRDPDIKWSRTEDDIARFAEVQSRMLASAAEVVRPGGRLVYATCSSEPDENAAVVQRFLAGDARYALAPAEPGTAVRRGTSLVAPEGWLLTLPYRDGLDAYFAAVLVRRRAA
jgi:16S rRNA (cytosine967-C5)-methyltransferase